MTGNRRSDDAFAGMRASRIKAVLREIVLERAAGGVQMPPKQSIFFGGGHFFQSMIASSTGKGIAICKWIGLAPDPAGGNQLSDATILVSEIATGRLLDVVAGNGITLERTAALSLLAFELSNKPDPLAIGFIGGGRQAITHLHAFVDAYPQLRGARVLEPRPAGGQAFVAACAERGVDCVVATCPEDVLANCDLIVSSVPGSSDTLGFLDAGMTRTDAFIAAVDLGRSWDSRSLSNVTMITDDLPQTQALIERNAFPLRVRFAMDLPALASGKATLNGRGRMMFAFSGSAYADLAAVVAMREMSAGPARIDQARPTAAVSTEARYRKRGSQHMKWR